METRNRSGRYALITGATSGFGYELAKLFAKDGYNLVLVARSEENLQELTTDLTQTFLIEVLPIAKDLFNPTAAEEIYSETTSKGIVIDVLVNNAGQGKYGLFVEYDSARDVDMIQLNITSLVCLTKLYLKEMVARNEGKILQLASLLGKYPTPYMSVYAATKAFVIYFTEGLINELKDTKITLTALLPGPSDTDFFHKAGAEETVTYKEDSLSSPAQVAKDGYDALMNGESRIISGAKNKMFAAMSNIMSDNMLATTMEKKMKPSEDSEGRSHITHGPSIEERDRIDKATGNIHGDYEEHEDHVHTKE